MDRLYLQNPLSVDTLKPIKTWYQRQNTPPVSDDTLWAVVDGAVVGGDGVESLQAAYGAPLRAFDQTLLADYEDLGLLLWPLVTIGAFDGLETLRTALGSRPAVSFIRTGSSVAPLCTVLTWLAAAVTDDGMPLYLRIGDTRVLAGLQRHLRPDQRAVVQSAVREWVWPDRTATARTAPPDAALASQMPADSVFVLDKPQYAALMDDAEADMLHVELGKALPDRQDARTGAQLHEWFSDIVRRTRALGLQRMQDQVAFAAFALRMPGQFETLPELGETWMNARNGVQVLAEGMALWGPIELQALERYWDKTHATQVPKG